MPHHITVDMGESLDISAFTHTPRQDQWEGGFILLEKLEISRDGESWGVVADDVPFNNVVNSRQQQFVRLPHRVDGHYFRLTALQTVKDEDLASAAEVSVMAETARVQGAASATAAAMMAVSIGVATGTKPEELVNSRNSENG